MAERPTPLDYLGRRVDVKLDDDTIVHGRLVSVGATNNLVLSAAERERLAKKRRRAGKRVDAAPKVIRDPLGLVFIRGESIVSIGYTESITTNTAVVDRVVSPQGDLMRAAKEASKKLDAPLR